MSHEGFHQAIWDDPDDDGVRLIYADWLEEQGDPRGEFIRLQVELARAPVDDPRRSEWECRAHQLLEDNEAEWLGSLERWVRGWRFHRGFVEAVEVEPRRFRAHADALMKAAPIRHLSLVEREAEDDQSDTGESRQAVYAAIAASPALRQVKSLNLGWDHVWNDLQLLLASPHLGQLSWLDAGGLGLHDDAIGEFAASTVGQQLMSLGLADSRFGDATLSMLTGSRRFTHLQALDLGGCAIEGPGLRALAKASWLEQVTDLHLANNPLVERDLAVLLACPRLKALTTLDLSSHGLARLGTPTLTALARNPALGRLSHLCLDGHVLNPEALRELVASPALPRLAVLSMNRCGLRAEAPKQLLAGLKARAAAGLPGLRALALGDNRFGSGGLRSLIQSPVLADVVALDLWNCDANAQDIECLASTPHLSKLNDLALAGSRVGTRGVSALAGSSSLGKLGIVILGGLGGITEAARWALTTSATLPWLREVRMDPYLRHVGILNPQLWGFPTRGPFRRRQGKEITED
jgi:uncharacterized protein (TIGR02996 family)